MKKKIDKLNKICYNTEVEKRYAPLPQLDRGLGYEPRRQGFESLKARQIRTVILIQNCGSVFLLKKSLTIWFLKKENVQYK